MKYLQWKCSACRLKNYIGVEDYADIRNEAQTCKFCHSTSIISYSNSLANKVQLKKCDEDAWKCSECFYSSKRFVDENGGVKDEDGNVLKYYGCEMPTQDGIMSHFIRGVCNKRMMRILKEESYEITHFCSNSFKHDHVYIALQSFGEMVGLRTYLTVYCKKHKIQYFIDYKSPVYEFKLPENNYFLATFSIVLVKGYPSLHVVIDAPDTTPLDIFTLENIDEALDLLKARIEYMKCK